MTKRIESKADARDCPLLPPTNKPTPANYSPEIGYKH
jgi:hypothetical protein